MVKINKQGYEFLKLCKNYYLPIKMSILIIIVHNNSTRMEVFMETYTYINLRINNLNGEVEVMGTKNVVKRNTMKDILELYKMLNIPTKNNKKIDEYEKVSKYDYSQKSSLDISTYAKI